MQGVVSIYDSTRVKMTWFNTYLLPLAADPLTMAADLDNGSGSTDNGSGSTDSGSRSANIAVGPLTMAAEPWSTVRVRLTIHSAIYPGS